MRNQPIIFLKLTKISIFSHNNSIIVPRETQINDSNFCWIKSKIKEDFNSLIKQKMTVIKQNKNDDIFFCKTITCILL